MCLPLLLVLKKKCILFSFLLPFGWGYCRGCCSRLVLFVSSFSFSFLRFALRLLRTFVSFFFVFFCWYVFLFVYYITEMWVLAFSCCPQPTIFIDALTGTCYTWTANSRMFFHVLLFFVFFWAKLRVFHRHFCEVFFLSLFLVYVSVFFFFFVY